MKRHLLGLFTLFCFSIFSNAQNTVDLPITFDDATVNYDLVDFGGNVSSIVTDPVSGITQVLMVDKTSGAQLWAGTTIGGAGLANPIYFYPGNTTLTMSVWSPDSGIVVRMKAEDPNDPTHSVETDALTTTSNAWETLTFDFSTQVSGTAPIDYTYIYQKLSVFFNFGVDGATAGPKTYYCDDIQFAPPVPLQVDLPITFDDSNVNYDLVDFGGNVSSIVVDPVSGLTQVLMVDKTAGAQLWAGTTIGGSGLANQIFFFPGNTTLNMRVWSPDSGIVVRMKAEDPTDPTHSVETDALTTTSNAWETLTFDFSNQASGTAPIDYTYIYQKLSVFFNFGVDGATAGPKTYYCDDIQFTPPVPTQLDLPITFDDATVNYDLVDFGGNVSTIVPDPVTGITQVLMVDKTAGAQLWAGTTVGGSGLANQIAFAPGNTTMTIRVWSPDAGIVVRLKAEDPNDPTHSVETDALTTTSNVWETLTFDFSNQASGTAPIDYTYIYQKLSVFFNFGVDGATAGPKTYYCDDIQFAPPVPVQVDLPITFDDLNVNYDLNDFGGNISYIVADPISGITNVLRVDKSIAAQSWAGTTIGSSGLANPIAFAQGSTTMTMQVLSPDSGIVVKLKVEDPNDPTHSVETDVLTTTSNSWETLTFDFSNQSSGTAPIDYTYIYQKLSVFFNFGVDGATAGAKTYYCDVIQFTPAVPTQVDLPVTFEDANTAYDLIDFGGNGSIIEPDPTGAVNLVCKTIKYNTAQLWAGTTIGGTAGFTNSIPFVSGATTMSMRIYSPDAGIPVRLKAEDPANGAISVETEAVTTTSNSWETLVFDFSNPVSGTAPINFSNNYQKLSVFFNFGTDGATAGTKTYYWDDVQFGGAIPAISVTFQVESPDSLPVYVFGSWSGWSNFPGTLLSATTMPGVYEGTITLNANTPYEYLFVNGGTPITEDLDPADPCTNGNAQYTNRTLLTGSVAMTVCNIWESCMPCTVVGASEIVSERYSVSVSSEGIRIHGDPSMQIRDLQVHDLLGRTLYSRTNGIEANTLLPFNTRSASMIVIRFTTDEGTAVFKAVRAD